MDKLKPIIKHRHTKNETVNTSQTVPTKDAAPTADTIPTGYAIDVYNAILQQASEAAAVNANRIGTSSAATAAPVKKKKCVPEQACKCGTSQDAANNTSNQTAKHDAVNHPSHYCQGGIECIDAIEAAVTGLHGMEAVCAGNVIKYTWRYHQKNGAEDLKKARFYLNKLILLVERNVNELTRLTERKGDNT